MSQTLVSFCIKSYNQRRYIKETLDAAMAQTYRPLEIIVSDNASTDGSWEEIRAYFAERILPDGVTVVLNRNERNLGNLGNWEKLCSLAKGELIVKADGDDVSLPERTAMIVAAWERDGRRALAICHSGYQIGPNGEPRGKLRPVTISWPLGAAMAFSPRIFRPFGFTADGSLVDDVVYARRAQMLGPTLEIPDRLVEYRLGSGATTDEWDLRALMEKCTSMSLAALRQLRGDLASLSDEVLAEPRAQLDAMLSAELDYWEHKAVLVKGKSLSERWRAFRALPPHRANIICWQDLAFLLPRSLGDMMLFVYALMRNAYRGGDGLSKGGRRRPLQASAAMRGMGWSMAGRLIIKVVQFGFSIVLARLLCPEDFGLVGMVAIFLALGTVLMDGGLVAALIQKTDRTEDDYATVVWSKLAVSSLLYVALFVSAPFVAAFYGRPELTAVMRVVTLGLPFAAITSTFMARLQVGARFRDLAIVSAVAVMLSGIVGVVLAGRGLGVWAVVGQGLSWHVFILILLIVANRWLPKVCFSFVSFRALFDFGWKHLIRSIVDTVYGNSYGVIIGKAFGAADLGFYNRANYYTSEVSSLVASTVNEVNYPLLSRIQDDEALLWRSYRRLQALVAAVMLPGMAVFAVFADVLIRLVIGPQWSPCVPYLRILSVGAAFSPLAALSFAMMYVKGRTDLALRLTLVEKAVSFGLLFAAMPFGIAAICAVSSGTTLMTFALNEYFVHRLRHS